MDESVPSPAHVPASSTKTPRYVWLGVVALVVIILAGLVYIQRAPILTAIQLSLLPPDLKSARYLAVGENGIQTYEIHGLSYAAGDSYEQFAALASSNGVSVGITKDWKSIERNGQSIAFATTTKTDIAISPSGEVLAFAELESGVSVPPGFDRMPRDPQQWNIHVYYPKTHTSVLLGEGVSPVFLGNDHVLWQTSRGLFLANLLSGEVSLVLPSTSRSVEKNVYVSLDGTHVAVVRGEAGSSRVALYSVANNQLTPVTDIQIPQPVLSYALGNEQLYTVELGNTAVGLRARALTPSSKSRLVLTLPAALSISRIILPTP